MRISDWSSDVCSSDLRAPMPADRGQGRDYARAVERASRSAEAVLQARASGAPVLEHQRQALQRATQALEQIRPGASRGLSAAMQRDPALLREAAAGRSGQGRKDVVEGKSVSVRVYIGGRRILQKKKQL